MGAQELNTIGLFLGMAGVVLIFVWGPPQPDLSEGVGLGLEDGTVLEDGRTVADHNQSVRSLRRRHWWLSRAGLVLVFFGFAFQLAAVWA